MDLTRRAALAAGIGVGLEALGCNEAPVPPVRPAAAEPGAIGRVGVVRGEDHVAAAWRAIELAGGLGSAGPGETVLLKVNTNSGDAYPYSSSPLVVRALAERLRAGGARVVVGDRSFWGDNDTLGNLQRNGIAAAVAAAGAELVVFDDGSDWVEVPPELVPHWVAPVRVPRLAVEAKLLINLPCVKTHFISGATLSLKNALGLVHPVDRARPGNLRSHDRAVLHVQVAELNRFLKPAMNLLDGFDALVSGGPTPTSGNGPRVLRTGTLIASRDRVATDAVGIALLRMHAASNETITEHATWHSPILRATRGLGLGIDSPRALELSSEGLLDGELERLAREGG